MRRRQKEPEPAAGTAFAQVVDAGRAMIRMLLSALPEDEHERDVIKARTEGMQSIILLCQRAGAGEVLVEPDGQRLVKVARRPVDELAKWRAAVEARLARLEGRAAPAPAPRKAPRILDEPKPRRAERSGTLGSGERKVLTAIAQHRDGVTREQLSVLTGFKRSTRDTYLQRLAERGFIDRGVDVVRALAQGIAELGSTFQHLPTGAALLRHWLEQLPDGEARVLRFVAGAKGDDVARDAITEATGFKRSTRDTYIQRLRARRLLVDGIARATVRASATLLG